MKPAYPTLPPIETSSPGSKRRKSRQSQGSATPKSTGRPKTDEDGVSRTKKPTKKVDFEDKGDDQGNG
jgi:hypothetical protein